MSKAGKTSEAVLDTQSSFVTLEVRGQDVSSEHESLDDNDVERNANLLLVLGIRYTFLIMKASRSE